MSIEASRSRSANTLSGSPGRAARRRAVSNRMLSAWGWAAAVAAGS
nr:hypothetical protein [Nocardia wallacei]